MKATLTMRQENAIRFGVELITKYGIGYTVYAPCRTLAEYLQSKGKSICWLSVRNYLEMLVKIGYAQKESRGSATLGVIYRLNRYKFNKLINGMNEQ